nr:translation initiation factor IF-2-like [Aegilops tauschii subsp. strangulata]
MVADRTPKQEPTGPVAPQARPGPQRPGQLPPPRSSWHAVSVAAPVQAAPLPPHTEGVAVAPEPTRKDPEGALRAQIWAGDAPPAAQHHQIAPPPRGGTTTASAAGLRHQDTGPPPAEHHCRLPPPREGGACAGKGRPAAAGTTAAGGKDGGRADEVEGGARRPGRLPGRRRRQPDGEEGRGAGGRREGGPAPGAGGGRKGLGPAGGGGNPSGSGLRR